MAQQTTGFQIWKPEIDAYIQDELETQPKSVYSEIFTVKTTDRLQINEVGYSGANPMDVVGELGDAVEDDDLEGYQTTYSRRNYRKQKTFSSDLMQTDQVGKAEEMARDLVRNVEISRNLHSFSVIRNMANSLYTLGDGVPLLSIQHPRKDGNGTQANTFADYIQKPLSYSAAIELNDVLLSLVSNKGNLLNVGATGKNKVLWYSEPLRATAFDIAGVDGADMQPDTGENNVNYIRRGEKFDVLEIPYTKLEAARLMGETTVAKTSSSNYYDSMWGIMDIDVCKKYWKMYVAEGYAKFDDEIKKANEAMVKYAYDKYAFGVSNFLGFVGSLGNNTTLAV